MNYNSKPTFKDILAISYLWFQMVFCTVNILCYLYWLNTVNYAISICYAVKSWYSDLTILSLSDLLTTCQDSIEFVYWNLFFLLPLFIVMSFFFFKSNNGHFHFNCTYFYYIFIMLTLCCKICTSYINFQNICL